MPSSLIIRDSGIARRIEAWLRTNQPHLIRNSSRKLITIASATTIIAAIALPYAYRDYRAFLGLGAGGVPHNVIGWLGVSLILCPLGKEMFGTEEYDHKPEKGHLLDEVPRREGPRPTVGRHVVPQRQLDQIPNDDIKEKLTTAFTTLFHNNPHLLKLSPSLHEKHTEALFLANDVPGKQPLATDLLREVSHIHGTNDYSVHVTLPPQDCKKVIEAGWAQRHAFSGNSVFKYTRGTAIYLPSEYVLIYAPRNERELEIVMSFVRASIAYLADVDVREVHA